MCAVCNLTTSSGCAKNDTNRRGGGLIQFQLVHTQLNFSEMHFSIRFDDYVVTVEKFAYASSANQSKRLESWQCINVESMDFELLDFLRSRFREKRDKMLSARLPSTFDDIPFAEQDSAILARFRNTSEPDATKLRRAEIDERLVEPMALCIRDKNTNNILIS